MKLALFLLLIFTNLSCHANDDGLSPRWELTDIQGNSHQFPQSEKGKTTIFFSGQLGVHFVKI